MFARWAFSYNTHNNFLSRARSASPSEKGLNDWIGFFVSEKYFSMFILFFVRNVFVDDLISRSTKTKCVSLKCSFSTSCIKKFSLFSSSKNEWVTTQTLSLKRVCPPQYSRREVSFESPFK